MQRVVELDGLEDRRGVGQTGVLRKLAETVDDSGRQGALPLSYSMGR